jgi:hypothetical protein
MILLDFESYPCYDSFTREGGNPLMSRWCQKARALHGLFFSPASGQIRLLLSDLSNLLYSNREYMSTLFPAGLSPAAAVLLL